MPPLSTPPRPATDASPVALHLPSCGASLAGVVFPSPQADPRALHRAITHTALVRVPPDGSVWLLRARGTPWTDARLHAAVTVLAGAGDAASTTEGLEFRLAEVLAGPPASVRLPRLDGVEFPHWDVRNAAVAWVLDLATRARAAPNAGEMAQRVDALVASINAALEAAHARFFATLDPEALAAARGDDAHAATYHYLLRAPHRRNRLQFAAAFPLLLRSAVQDDAAGKRSPLARLVDDGTPLVKALAREWRVSPSALRCLIQVPVAVAGAGWRCRPHELVVALDALRAQDLPGRDAASWARFNRLAGRAEEMFGRRLMSALPLSWLREAAARSRHRPDLQLPDEALDEGVVVLVDELRAALIDALEDVPLRSARRPDDDPASAARNVADTFLARLAPRRLARLATDYRSRLGELRSARAPTRADPANQVFWSLLAEPHASADGSRRVLSLDSIDALKEHGLALRNCLGGLLLDEYASLGRRGKAFVLGVFDAASGVPLSAVELRPRRPQFHGPPSLRVVQHTAAHNARPTPACRAAVEELVRQFEREPHLRRLEALLRGARSGLERRHAEEAKLQEEALRRAIGTVRYEALLAALAAHPASAASGAAIVVRRIEAANR